MTVSLLLKQEGASAVSPYKFAAPASLSCETSSKQHHILKRIRHCLLLHLLFSPKATKCLLKNARSWWLLSRFLRMATECSTSQKTEPAQWSFRRKCRTIKDGTKTYNFIADESCLLFSIILKVLSGSEKYRIYSINHPGRLFYFWNVIVGSYSRWVLIRGWALIPINTVIRTQGKCIKSYKNFWKDFVVEQNLTRLKGDFWSYLNRPYEIIVVWDDREAGNMDPYLPLLKVNQCEKLRKICSSFIASNTEQWTVLLRRVSLNSNTMGFCPQTQ